ncbi:MAG TPA: hypothetical protein VEJ18_00650 [Planctomycetota bacterium]|nr:hypothetical protein [Planctomycetota bacterium]
MKHLLWTVLILAVVLSGRPAPTAGVASLVAPAPAAIVDGGASHVFVANSSGSVTVKTPAGTTVTTLTGAPFNFSQPYDVVAVPQHDLVVVSNNGNGTLTVFNGRTFAFVQVVNLAGAPLNATNLRGMSVSEDESAVFIAGEHSGNPAVFGLSLPDLTPSLTGFITDATASAEDCVVVRSSAVGGTGGDGPGRVYFSAPQATTGNYLGIIHINPAGPIGSIDLAQAPLANITNPGRLERTPDHSVVFVGCTTADAATVQRIGRIQVGATDVFSQPVVRNTVQSLAHRVVDIAFRSDGRGYVIGNIDSGGNDIIEIDGTGARIPAGGTSAAGVPASDRIRFDPYPPRLYIGESSGTANQYGVRNATTQPVGAVTLVASGVGPRAFAFMQNGPYVSGVWPSGLHSQAGAVVELVGTRFDPASTVEFYNSVGVPFAPPTTFVSPTRLQVDASALPPNLYEVRVTNPGLLDFRLVDYFLSIQPPVPGTTFTMPTPSRSDGYRLRSFPQYHSAGDLLDAVRATFGGYNPSLVRIFTYDGGYVELDDLDPATDLSGRAFWIMTRNGGDLTLARPPVGESLQGTGQSNKVVILQDGWNLLAMPSVGGVANVRMSMNDVSTFGDGALSSIGTSLEAAALAGTVSFPIRFVNNGYVSLAAGDSLYAGTGYWIRNNTSAPLYLVFNHTDAQPDNRPPGDVWTQYRTTAPAAARAASAAADSPPPPPGAGLHDESGGSGCGLLGLELLLLPALCRRRRLRA